MIEIIFICTTIIFAYTTFNLMRKLEKKQDNLLEQDDDIVQLKIGIRETINRMKEIDSKNAFESDDEVGAVFNALKDLVYNLENIDEA